MDAVAHAGADAAGFILYARSPRAVSIERAAQLVRRLPPFVTPVLLFVNATDDEVLRARELMPHAVLQFHGDETPQRCERWSCPYLKAVRVQESINLLEYQQNYVSAQALLLDTYSHNYGGSGEVFNWSLIPKEIAHQVVLAGGLNVANVAQAIGAVWPWAVDVSSGVEVSPGIKDTKAIDQFVQAVRNADAC